MDEAASDGSDESKGDNENELFEGEDDEFAQGNLEGALWSNNEDGIDNDIDINLEREDDGNNPNQGLN